MNTRKGRVDIRGLGMEILGVMVCGGILGYTYQPCL